jgi:hypothetical protein
MTLVPMSRDSSVGIVLGYGLDYWGSRVRLPAGLGIFLFTTASRTVLGPTQPSIQWVPGAFYLGVKRPGREADHSLHLVPRSRMCGAIPSLPQYVLMSWCLVKAQGQLHLHLHLYLYLYFTFTFTASYPVLYICEVTFHVFRCVCNYYIVLYYNG